MHECLSVQGWIKAWGDPEREGRQLASCPRCSEARGSVEEWLAAVQKCPGCKAALDATPIEPDEILECPRCMAAFEKLHQILDELEHFDPSVATEALRAEELLARLVRLPVPEQLGRVTDDLSYQQWVLCQRLLYEAREQWCHAPEIANDRATVAVAIADRLHPESYHPLWVHDLRGKAHAYLANTYRILADFSLAEREFLLAEQHVRQGVGSGRWEARVFSLKASLLIDQARYVEAESLLDRVGRFYRKTDQPVEIGRTQMKRAKVLAFREEYGSAADECAKAAASFDPRKEPRLSLLARQNAVHYLVHAGEVQGARGVFDRLPPTEERMVALRRKWIEADLLRAEGQLLAALDVYEEARRGYREEGIFYDVALLSLDQALTAFELGDTSEMAAMAEEASILLVKAGAKPQALVALRVLLAAIERQSVTRAALVVTRRRIAALQPS